VSTKISNARFYEQYTSQFHARASRHKTAIGTRKKVSINFNNACAVTAAETDNTNALI
jgi:hypothetical protein